MPKPTRAPSFVGLLLGTTALAGMAIFPSTAQAAVTTWTGTASSDWYTAGNWDNGAPNLFTPVVIGSNTPNATVIDGGTAQAEMLLMGNGTSALTIQNAGNLTGAVQASVGQDAGSNATVTVKGASTWSVLGTLWVGESGTGTLTISGASAVTDANAVIGLKAGSSGAVTVTGSGSNWSTDQSLIVGNRGAGSLTIASGGTVADFDASVGGDVGGSGNVVVTGAGSAWTNRTVSIGDVGVGKVTVSGAGATMTYGPSLYVGNLGQGTLNVFGGGMVSGKVAIVGQDSQSHGEVTIDGTGSNWNTLQLVVGNGGVGALTVSNGGNTTVTLAGGIIGEAAGAKGSVLVTGAGSQLDVIPDLIVGEAGTGSLTISDGGTAADSNGLIGEVAGSIGRVTVAGAGSTWTNSSELHVGAGGTGTLTVSNGGQVTAGVGTVGDLAGSSGTVTVDGAGSSWASIGGMYVGFHGTAALTIQNQGQVSSNASARIADGSDSSATVTVTGAGSRFTVDGNDLWVGEGGQGTLIVSNGGQVNSVHTNVGYAAGANGTVIVDGAGSTWAASAQTTIGQSGTGVLIIANGGKVSSAGALIGGLASGVGTVEVTGAGSSWNLQDNSSLEVGNSGSAGLQILNGGSVDAHTTYVGFQAGSDGNVVVDGANSTLINDFTHVGTEGTGKLVLKNGGTLVSPNVVVSEAANGSGTVVIGADLADAATAPGYIKSSEGIGPAFSFGAGGSGTLIFNHTSSNYAFDAMIDGGGTIYQKAGTTYLTANSSGYTGNAYVTVGKLVVNGDLSGGSVIVSDGGTVGGSGTVLNLSAEAATTGGIIAPGNSIGTLHVGNAVKFDPGSIYQVQVNAAGASDLIAAGGTATINGGTVEALAAPGKYAASTQYTILTAAGGVSGAKYTAATVDSPFLTASLSYDPNDVFLTLDRINANVFHNAGQTPNEQAAGSGLDSVAVGNAAANALFGLSSPAQASALDQLSGEIHASVKGVILEDSRYVREAINDRLRRSFGDTTTPTTGEAAAGAGLWTSTFGSFGTTNADGNAAKLDSEIGGVFVGADGTLTDGFRLGILGGYTRGTYDSSTRNSSATTDSFDAAIYSGFEAGSFGLRVGADYAVHSINTDRSVSFPGFNDQTQAAYTSQTSQVFGELGYKIAAGSTSFEPFAAAAYVRQSMDGFTEAGGLSALSGQADAMAATFTTLRLRMTSNFDLGMTTGKLHGSLGWRHAFGDLTPTATVAFANGDPFTVSGAPLATDAAVLDAGIDLAVLKDVTFGVSYSGQLSKSGVQNGAKANLNWQF
ncbi:autotransporter domain-containing protein [Mesorhizobium sp. ORM6]